jgi:hypothetical protein
MSKICVGTSYTVVIESKTWIHKVVRNLSALCYPKELVCLFHRGIFAHKGYNPEKQGKDETGT